MDVHGQPACSFTVADIKRTLDAMSAVKVSFFLGTTTIPTTTTTATCDINLKYLVS